MLFLPSRPDPLLTQVYSENLSSLNVAYKEGWAKLTAPQTVEVNGEVLEVIIGYR